MIIFGLQMGYIGVYWDWSGGSTAAIINGGVAFGNPMIAYCGKMMFRGVR